MAVGEWQMVNGKEQSDAISPLDIRPNEPKIRKLNWLRFVNHLTELGC